jgi:hypothetical protein
MLSCCSLEILQIAHDRSWFQVVLYMKNHEDVWKETGRTDKASNDLNPVFVQPIQIVYKWVEIRFQFYCWKWRTVRYFNPLVY